MADATPPTVEHDDSELTVRLGLVLRRGVLLSAAVIFLGGILFLVRHGGEPVPDRSRFTPIPETYSRPIEILQAAMAGSGRALIQVGLLLLVATPILRVAYSVIAFARRRDLLYLILTLIVLAVLLFGLFTGQGG